MLLGFVVPPSHTLQINSTTLQEPSSDIGATAVEFTWSDLKSEEYKAALLSEFDKHREERYNHLSDEQFSQLREVVTDYSHVLVIDGAEPTVVSGYHFDIELVEGAQPVRHQLPKRSPEEKKRQRYHLQKEEAAGHLRIPTDAQKSDWATRTHIVSKKDDPMGRWICDFRPLNRLTIKRVTALGDVFSKTRSLAAKVWKTGLDAWSGFNQMNATERARQLMQIITDFGVRQWTVLPFGVANGPSYFQEFMLDLYGGSGSSDSKPNMLGDAMQDLDAQLEVWVDDVQLGTGSVFNSSGEMDVDVTCPKAFKQHLEAIKRVFDRAASANLRFKLSKCYFCQFSLDTLGMVAGLGVVKTDPKKIQAIAEWPRPSRPEDVERFLASTVFFERTFESTLCTNLKTLA